MSRNIRIFLVALIVVFLGWLMANALIPTLWDCENLEEGKRYCYLRSPQIISLDPTESVTVVAHVTYEDARIKEYEILVDWRDRQEGARFYRTSKGDGYRLLSADTIPVSVERPLDWEARWEQSKIMTVSFGDSGKEPYTLGGGNEGEWSETEVLAHDLWVIRSEFQWRLVPLPREGWEVTLDFRKLLEVAPKLQALLLAGAAPSTEN